MHRPVPPERPAKLRYLSGDYIVEEAGSYVVCAVTGEQIDIEVLRYWSADRQEAYATAVAATKRHQDVSQGR